MVTRDADTFVALGQAVTLAALEGAVEPDEAADLCEALVAGILTGCMEFDTYGRVHGVMAALLDRAFEGPARPPTPPLSSTSAVGLGDDEPLGVYLEVVGEAWDAVGWDEETCAVMQGMVRSLFHISEGAFGQTGWFQAPLEGGLEDVMASARRAGLMVVSVAGVPTGPGPFVGTLVDPSTEPHGARLVLAWGERRVALDVKSRAA